MKNTLLLVSATLCCSLSFSQSPKTLNKHTDQTFAYEVAIPDWWAIRETPPNLFGGTLPAIKTIENAVIFKCFAKDKFKDLAEFEAWVIKGCKTGDSPKWSPETMVLAVKDIPDFKKLGNAWAVQILRGDSIFDCCYIVTQTSKSYIWIDFTATSSTYAPNYDKFREIVNGFKAL